MTLDAWPDPQFLCCAYIYILFHILWLDEFSYSDDVHAEA